MQVLMLLKWVLLIFTLLGGSNAFTTLPNSRRIARSRGNAQLTLASTTTSDDTTAVPRGPSAGAQVMGSIESALESLTGDPQALLEAVVGLDKGGIAAYDRKFRRVWQATLAWLESLKTTAQHLTC